MVIGFHDIETDPLFARILAAGESLRRIDRAEELNADGQRSVWHQGKELTELTSWENASGALERQELIFLGFALEYRQGFGLRTGVVQEDRAESGMPSADLMQYDEAPSLRVLELSSRLLREARRDYYTQHLLGQLNDALSMRFNRPHTQVYRLTRWKERLRRASDGLRHLRTRRTQIAFYLGVGMVVGALVTLAILAIS